MGGVLWLGGGGGGGGVFDEGERVKGSREEEI